jgi:hypothetical protein
VDKKMMLRFASHDKTLEVGSMLRMSTVNGYDYWECVSFCPCHFADGRAYYEFTRSTEEAFAAFEKRVTL